MAIQVQIFMVILFRNGNVFELLKNDTHSPVPQKILLKFGIRMYYHKLHLR